MADVVKALRWLADAAERQHGDDSDWWKGHIAGLRRAACLVEVQQAFEETADA